jgi:hypothetical protein
MCARGADVARERPRPSLVRDALRIALVLALALCAGAAEAQSC